MRRYNRYVLIGIIVLAVLAVWVVWPQNPSNYLPGFINWPKSQGVHIHFGPINLDRQGMRLGLDLQGGTHLVYQADLSKAKTPDAIEGAIDNIKRRVDAYGVTEPQIQRKGENRILIQLPGIRDVDEAINLIGKTAYLDFREKVVKEDGTEEWVPVKAKGSDGVERVLDGSYINPPVFVEREPQTGTPVVHFEFNDEGGKMFQQITSRLIGQPLGIYLDQERISAPIVRAVIGKSGIIEGLTLAEARTLAIQLNSGALPVPLSVVERHDVDPTLGADTIAKSKIAGSIGLGLLLLFMVLYYRLPGILACCALFIYASLLLSVFKLIPVTLTLAGIAAFILSLGMAVDANVLIFERMKEELRAGRSLRAAIEAGFDRAWPSIRDSNFSTFITCIILWWFGDRFGASQVTGFAITLFIGVAVSMFSAMFVTRTFLRALVGSAVAQKIAFFAP